MIGIFYAIQRGWKSVSWMAVIMVTILRADCKKILSLEKGIPKSLNDKPDERGINLRKKNVPHKSQEW